MKGFKKDAFIVAVILVACKQEQGGRTLKSIAKTTNIDEKDIKKFYKVLIRDSSITSIGTQGRKSIEEQTKDLIESFCNRLQLPYSLNKQAKEIAERAIHFLEGKRPSSIAAAAILFAMNLNRIQHKQQEVAAVAGVSSNTLRNVYKELKYSHPSFLCIH